MIPSGVTDSGDLYADHGLTLRWAARTDVGRRRRANEDSFIAAAPLFVVADGMGGHAAGDKASQAVAARLSEAMPERFADLESLLAGLLHARDDIDEVAVGLYAGVGTTVTGILVAERGAEPAFLVFNVGDSRVYALRGSKLERLTIDHSVVQELLDAHLIEPEQAEDHPEANVVTRAIGFHEEPDPDLWLVPIVAGERFLACSDGLTKELPEAGIRAILSSGADPAETADALVAAALDGGGSDNITVVVLDVVAAPAPAKKWRTERLERPQPSVPEDVPEDTA